MRFCECLLFSFGNEAVFFIKSNQVGLDFGSKKVDKLGQSRNLKTGAKLVSLTNFQYVLWYSGGLWSVG